MPLPKPLSVDDETIAGLLEASVVRNGHHKSYPILLARYVRDSAPELTCTTAGLSSWKGVDPLSSARREVEFDASQYMVVTPQISETKIVLSDLSEKHDHDNDTDKLTPAWIRGIARAVFPPCTCQS